MVTPGRTYRVSAWYKTTGRAGFVASYRTSSGWRAWVSGPDLPTSSTYRLGEWTLPPVPAATATTRGLLRVSSTREPFVTDVSDSAFTIVPGTGGP